jgi:hypothetical protein
VAPALRVEIFINKMIIIVELRNQKMTEVKTNNSVETQNFMNLINYIAMHESNLANYTTKLKENFVILAQKIPDVSIYIEDTEPFYNYHKETANGIQDDDYYLVFNNKHLQVMLIQTHYDVTQYKEIRECSRKILKEIIQSGRLSKFLSHAVQTLAQTEQEYKEASNAIEKIVTSIT